MKISKITNNIKIYVNSNPKLCLSLFLGIFLLLSFIFYNKDSWSSGLATEIIGIAITIFFIDYLISGPKRLLKENTKYEMNRVLFNFGQDISELSGFEEEYDKYYFDLIEYSEEDSFAEAISKLIIIFKPLHIEDYKNKTKNFKVEDLKRLSIFRKSSSKLMKEFRRDYYIILDAEEMSVFLKMDSAINIMHKNILALLDILENKKSNIAESHFRNALAYNIMDFIENAIILVKKK